MEGYSLYSVGILLHPGWIINRWIGELKMINIKFQIKYKGQISKQKLFAFDILFLNLICNLKLEI
jgi:hypothetical protein